MAIFGTPDCIALCCSRAGSCHAHLGVLASLSCRAHVSYSLCRTLTTASSGSSRRPRCPSNSPYCYLPCHVRRTPVSARIPSTSTRRLVSPNRISDPSPAIIAQSPFPHRRCPRVRFSQNLSPVTVWARARLLNVPRGVMQSRLPRRAAVPSHRAREALSRACRKTERCI
ncbi:hypothetical protein OH77DRAFT_1286749 [Trametes cingulata]|nr:hypothetical protein OH77DRAFT_1286749 [Trametes cingulata]